MRSVYVEVGANLAFTGGAAAWSFDLDLWGICAQGVCEEAALAAWRSDYGDPMVVEVITGDELAFRRDARPAIPAEFERTMGILREQRSRALAILDTLPEGLLHRDDPARHLPAWARWRTVAQTLWHITDVESRYYLPQLGLPGRPRAATLRSELELSLAHTLVALDALDPAARRVSHGEQWTTTKLLRRLAWHERGELEAVEALLDTWLAAEPNS